MPVKQNPSTSMAADSGRSRSDRDPNRDEPPAAGHRDGLPMRRDQDTTQLRNQHSRYPRRGLPRCHREHPGYLDRNGNRDLTRVKILSETGLTTYAGISYNKFLAKLASDHRKPNGQLRYHAKDASSIRSIPLGKFHGFGPAASVKMNGLSIFTGMDMCNQTLGFLNARFGKAGSYYYWISRAIGERPIRANRIRKFVGAENPFSQGLADYDALAAELQPLVDKVWGHCEATGARGRTATPKVKFPISN
ncbi:hypothetical protein V1294_006219 [Bradyrhizobium sp. AZCC 1678]